MMHPAERFLPVQVSIYDGERLAVPGTSATYSNQPALVAAAFDQGNGCRFSAAGVYTHIFLVADNLVISDAYNGTGIEPDEEPNVIEPTPGSGNLYKIVFAYLALVPGIGRRRVCLCDRYTVGNVASLV